MKVFFHTLNDQHWQKLQQLADVIWHQCYKDLLSAKQIDYMLEKFLSVPVFKRQEKEGYIYRGLFVDDEMVGFTASHDEKEEVFLSKLYLLEQYHHKGLGRKMIEDVINLYPQAEKMYLTVNKHNETLEMYRHLGFEITSQQVSDIGEGYVMDDYVMHLCLRKENYPL